MTTKLPATAPLATVRLTVAALDTMRDECRLEHQLRN